MLTTAIATVVAVAAMSVAIADELNSAPQLVDALHTAFGVHHARAVHAKGVITMGRFVPSKEARTLSSALLFARPSTPVYVRFSDFTGIPDIPDTVGDANPRGMTIKFQGSSGDDLDIVAHSFNGFPVRDADQFADLMRAIGASGEGAVKPTALDQFLDAHPAAKTFLTTQKPAPESYAALNYFGVNAFAFTTAAGQRFTVRYRFVPQAGEHVLDAAALATRGPDYLQTELPARLAKSPVRFDWYAQIAEAADSRDDPSKAWPESRRLVKLGTLTLESMARDPVAADKKLLFLPGRVPPGIEAVDPMIARRDGAYAVSFGPRQ